MHHCSSTSGMLSTCESPTHSPMTDNKNAQALAFAVAALQAMPQSRSAAVEPTLIPSKDESNAISSSAASEDVVDVMNENNAAKRLQRSRERNREHARRTRLRKKAQLAALQERCQELSNTRKALQQQVEDRSIASILLGLSSHAEQTNVLPVAPVREHRDDVSSSMDEEERPRSEAHPLQVTLNGVDVTITSHINWKTGQYTDENGKQKQLSVTQLESLRRERNRMHAKMTRDRKKNFIATTEKAIEDLENDISHLRSILQSTSTASASVISPELSARPSPPEEAMSPVVKRGVASLSGNCNAKRICHGFSLDS